MSKVKARMAVGLPLLLCGVQAYAQSGGGNEAALGGFLTSSANWLVTVLGPGVFVIGVIMVGISLAMGDQDALRRGGYVIGGGAMIFLSQAFVSLLKRLAGG